MRNLLKCAEAGGRKGKKVITEIKGNKKDTKIKASATTGTKRKKGKAEEFPKPTAEKSKEARLKRRTFINKRDSERKSLGNRKRRRTGP